MSKQSELFSLDPRKDQTLIGKTFTIKNMEKDGRELKGKLIDITLDGSYEFKITSQNTEYDSFITKIPNSGDVVL